MMDASRGLECFWSDPKDHPQCPHGPTLLFGEYFNGEVEQFYACAACRDRKMCKFYLKHGEELKKERKAFWDQERKKLAYRYPHQKLYINFHKIMAESPEKRCYCHNCEKLVLVSEKDKHNDHKITESLTDYQMNHPTEILKPLDNSKKEAQYFFSKKSTEDIVNMLLKLGAKHVLCIGTPRIHEYIMENYEHKISSLLLDLDGRFHNFFGPLNYCWYNLLNHHFFDANASEVFKDFLTQDKGEHTYLICDPPFGSRVEAMSWSIKKIFDLHKKWNDITVESDCLKIMFIFPYFMESVMRQKSNPPSVSGGLKDLKMSDYKVDYENHPLFVTEAQNNKLPSPIRIFTNVPLNLLELPESDGYKYCKKCEKWVSSENKHCKKCKACTSKNGMSYKHCNKCERCVKPSWKHCDVCNRCALKTHKCGQKPKVSGRCFKCSQHGHTENDCSASNGIQSNTLQSKKVKKRKLNNESDSKIKSKILKASGPKEEENKQCTEEVENPIQRQKKLEKVLPKSKIAFRKIKSSKLHRNLKLSTKNTDIPKKKKLKKIRS